MDKGVEYFNGLLYRGTTTPLEFEWDMLMPDIPMLQVISAEDIQYLKDIITSPRYAGNSKLRISKINELMIFRGFTKFAGGTNRLVYIHPLAPNMVFKVAVDAVGIEDNPAEYYNQRFLKPYCTKVFECSPCGTIASFQKVDRITTFDEFYTMLDDYYRLIKYNIIGKYVMEDIGMDYFMNFGTWAGRGLVILDFPYLYELDGAKLYCNATLEDKTKCHGEIDYTPGFNKLICTKCGKTYRARDLAKSPENGGILLRRKGAVKMKFSLKKGNEVVKTFDTNKEVEFLSKDGNSNSNENAVKPVRLIKKKVIVKKEEPIIRTHSISENRVIKHVGTPISQRKKEDVKVVTKTINVGNHITEESNEPVIKKIHLRKVKKTIEKDSLPAIPRRTKVINARKVNDRNNRRVENTPSANVVKRVINVSIGKSINDDINTSKDEKSIEVNLVKVKKPVTVSTSVVKRLGKGSVIKNEKILDKKDNFKKEVKILNIGHIIEEKPETTEEEKNDIIIDTKAEEVSKDIIETNDETAEVITNEDSIDITSNEETADQVESIEEDINSDNSNKEEYVHFVKNLPIEVDQYDEDTLFALYVGSDENFEEHIEKMMHPIYVDINNYDLYVLHEGEFYLTDGYDEDGKMILLYDTGENESYEESDASEETSDSSNSITEDDIINELRKSGKPSIEDLL